jgi:predicted phosphodiesterase
MRRLPLIFIVLCLAIFGCADKSGTQDEHNMLATLHNYFNKEELTLHENIMLKNDVKAVFFGHGYELLNYTEEYNTLIREINEQRPDYVFFLGDMVYDNTIEEWTLLNVFLDNIDANVYFVPGNHDLNFHDDRYNGRTGSQWQAESLYLEQVGYRYKTVRDNYANFLLLNMNDSIGRIENYLDTMTKHLFADLPTLVLSHQNVWNWKTQTEDSRTWTQKSMSRDEILPLLDDYRYLVHGDWNEQFRQGPEKYNGHRFHTVACGNKQGTRLHFTVAQLSMDTVIFRPKYVNLAPESPWLIPMKK